MRHFNGDALKVPLSFELSDFVPHVMSKRGGKGAAIEQICGLTPKEEKELKEEEKKGGKEQRRHCFSYFNNF